MIPTYSRETPRAARTLPPGWSLSRAVSIDLKSKKRPALAVRIVDKVRLWLESEWALAIADVVLFLVIVGVCWLAWVLS